MKDMHDFFYTVLIVEDEPIEQEFIKSMVLKSCRGEAQVITCRDGVEAVKLAEKHRPELIFMDLWISRLDGISAIAKIREHLPAACISILTGHMDFSCAQKAIRYSVFEYLVKPVRPAVLKDLADRMRLEADKVGIRSRGAPVVSGDGGRMEGSIDYIHEHFREKLTLEEVAAKEFMSPAYFSRTFRKEMGITFSKYVLELKIKHACKLLKETRFPAYRVAAECGFSDSSYFNRVFAQRMETTPTAYRKTILNTGK